MKNTIYYIIREKPLIVVYFTCFLFLFVCYPFTNTYITREFKTISKYSDDEIMIQYNKDEYKIYEKGEYEIHGNLITTKDKSENIFILTWSFVQLTLLLINVHMLYKTGDLKKRKIDIYFALDQVYVDTPRELSGKYKYIYDGKIFFEHSLLLTCNYTLSDALDNYFKNPDAYKDYV